MPELVPSASPRSSGARPPSPAAISRTDSLARAKIALSLGAIDDALRFLAPLLEERATLLTLEAFTLAAEAALEHRDLPQARALILRAGRESGLSLADCNVQYPGDDYTAAQLRFDGGILAAQAGVARGEAPEGVWFNQATYTPEGVFCLVDQRSRRLLALDSLGRLLWGKQLSAATHERRIAFAGQPSLLLSQRPDEGISYIDNQYGDFSRLNRFAAYQSLYPLGAKHSGYGSFTQDFFGNLYATCADSRTIAIFTEDGTPIKEICLADIDVPPAAMPYSILGDDEGHIYLYDTQVLVVLNRYGHPLHRHYFPPQPIPAALRTGLPGGMQLAADGALWLVRPQERQVICIDPETNTVLRTVGPALSTGPLQCPVDVLTDWAENLFIVDAGAACLVRVNGDDESSVLFSRPWWRGQWADQPAEPPARLTLP